LEERRITQYNTEYAGFVRVRSQVVWHQLNASFNIPLQLTFLNMRLGLNARRRKRHKGPKVTKGQTAVANKNARPHYIFCISAHIVCFSEREKNWDGCTRGPNLARTLNLNNAPSPPECSTQGRTSPLLLVTFIINRKGMMGGIQYHIVVGYL